MGKILNSLGTIPYNGREYTPKEWYEIQLAIIASEARWEESNHELLNRMKQMPLPDITINGRKWKEWEP